MRSPITSLAIIGVVVLVAGIVTNLVLSVGGWVLFLKITVALVSAGLAIHAIVYDYTSGGGLTPAGQRAVVGAIVTGLLALAIQLGESSRAKVRAEEARKFEHSVLAGMNPLVPEELTLHFRIVEGPMTELAEERLQSLGNDVERCGKLRDNVVWFETYPATASPAVKQCARALEGVVPRISFRVLFTPSGEATSLHEIEEGRRLFVGAPTNPELRTKLEVGYDPATGAIFHRYDDMPVSYRWRRISLLDLEGWSVITIWTGEESPRVDRVLDGVVLAITDGRQIELEVAEDGPALRCPLEGLPCARWVFPDDGQAIPDRVNDSLWTQQNAEGL